MADNVKIDTLKMLGVKNWQVAGDSWRQKLRTLRLSNGLQKTFNYIRN